MARMTNEELVAAVTEISKMFDEMTKDIPLRVVICAAGSLLVNSIIKLKEGDKDRTLLFTEMYCRNIKYRVRQECKKIYKKDKG